MDKFLTLLIQDPILLVASLVLVVTAAILAWAIKSLLVTKDEVSYDLSDEEISDEKTAEPTGITEARLAEINTQLTELNKRLSELDKSVKENQALPAMTGAPELEKMVQRIESKLEKTAATPSPHEAEVLGRIEAKLEGIHKLLILLTDSGK